LESTPPHPFSTASVSAVQLENTLLDASTNTSHFCTGLLLLLIDQIDELKMNGLLFFEVDDDERKL
jgi:hypothetical protein